MSNKLYEENDIQAIANAIREKNGSTDTYKVSEMANAIDTMTNPIIEALNDRNIYGKNLYSGEQDIQVSTVGKSIQIDNIEPNTEYTMSLKKTRIAGATITNSTVWGIIDIKVYDEDDTELDSIRGYYENVPANTSKKFTKTFTTVDNATYIKVGISNNNSDTNVNTIVSEIQLEKGSIATDYEPYNTFTIPEISNAIENISGGGDILDITNNDRFTLQDNVLVINNTELNLVEVFNGGTFAEGYTLKQTSSGGVAPTVSIGSTITVSATSNSSTGSEGQLYIDKQIDFSKVEKIEIYGSGSTSNSNKTINGGIFRIVTDYSKVTSYSDNYAAELGCTSSMFTNGKAEYTQSKWEGVKNGYLVIRSRVNYGGYNYTYSISKIVIYIREDI